MKSEWQLLADLAANGSFNMSADEIYKACVAVAIHGQKRIEEKLLNSFQQDLLNCRRLIFSGKMDASKRIAHYILSNQDANLSEKADAYFILGTIYNRSGNRFEAKANFLNSAKISPDSHKQLRAVINSKICESKCASYICGELYALGQTAIRSEFYDLAGNIYKGMAIELLNAEKFLAATDAASKAEEFYSRDGCAEDRALNNCILAIANVLLGNLNQAQKDISRISEPVGKVKIYFDLYESLIHNRKMRLPKGHPLEKLLSHIRTKKSNSIGNKILRLLTENAMSRDELIYAIWGELATDSSYCNRLYTAINQLRKRYRSPIIFDGERYKISVNPL
jgi:hypothetical protein